MTKNWRMSTVYLNDSMKRLVEKYSGRVGESRTGGTGTTLAELASRYDALMKKERPNVKCLLLENELKFLAENICNKPFKCDEKIFDELCNRIVELPEDIFEPCRITKTNSLKEEKKNLVLRIAAFRYAEKLTLIDILEEMKMRGVK